MLSLENQVCSLELAKKLKSLNVEQESLFYWVHPSAWWGSGSESCLFPANHVFASSNLTAKDVGISAPTSSELGEMLPEEMVDEHEDFPYFLTCQKTPNGWAVSYEGDRGTLGDISFEDENLANSLASMLIHLIENGLMLKV